MNYVICLYSHNALDPVVSIPTAAWYTTQCTYLALTGAGGLIPARSADFFPLFLFVMPV
jgi:hypothetical protein